MTTEVRDVVSSAWSEVLKTPAHSGSNFFSDNGDSLLAMEMVEMVEKRLGIEFPLETLFLDGEFDAVVTDCEQRYKAGRSGASDGPGAVPPMGQ